MEAGDDFRTETSDANKAEASSISSHWKCNH
jgi:hypothetical protein